MQKEAVWCREDGKKGRSPYLKYGNSSGSISVFTDFADLVPQGDEVLEGRGLAVRIAQKRSRMQRRHEQGSLLVEEFSVIFGDRQIFVDHLLCGNASQANHDLGTQQLKLLTKPGHAGGGFLRQRIAVFRRSTFDYVGNKDVAVTVQIDGFQVTVQQFSASSDEGKTLFIFVGTGPFSHKQYFGVGNSLSEYHVLACFAKAAPAAGKTFGFQCFKIHKGYLDIQNLPTVTVVAGQEMDILYTKGGYDMERSTILLRLGCLAFGALFGVLLSDRNIKGFLCQRETGLGKLVHLMLGVTKMVVCCAAAAVIAKALPASLSILYAGLGLLMAHIVLEPGKAEGSLPLICIWLVLYLPFTGMLACLGGSLLVLAAGESTVAGLAILVLGAPMALLQFGPEGGLVLLGAAISLCLKQFLMARGLEKGRFHQP